MPRTYSAEEARNREIVLDFYNKAIVNWDYDAAKVHVGNEYVQHSPSAADGAEGLRAFIDGVPGFVRANLRVDIRRVLVDGDIVAIHTRNELMGMGGRVIIDLFRVADGKIVEHWDVVQDVPETSLNSNDMA